MESSENKRMSKRKYKAQQFFIKSIYIVPALFVSMFTLAAYFIYFWISKRWYPISVGKLGTFIGALSGLNGFFVAVTGFIIALNKHNPITQKFFVTDHPKYMLYACILGVLAILIALILYLLIDNVITILCFSAFSIGEILVTLYYILHLFKQYISVEKDWSR